jgi:4-amino-4-deoxy-L-arabinose transferase-like glycosyltransferase
MGSLGRWAALAGRREARAVALVAGVALVVRVVVAIAQHDSALVFDAQDYDRHARSIAAGDGYPATQLAEPGSPTALRPPAYPYLLGAVYRLTGDSQTAGRLVGALLGAVTVVLVYALGRLVWSHTAGLVAAGVAAVFPPMVAVSTALLSEALFVPVALAAAVALVAHLRGPPRVAPALALGALCGLATLTRSNGAAVAIVAAVALVAAAPRGSRRGALLPAAALLAAAALVVSPWVIRNASEFDGRVLLTTAGGYNLTLAYNPVSEHSPRARFQYPPSIPELRPLFRRPGIDEAELNERLGERARDFARDHPGYVAEVVWWNSLRMLSLPPGDPDNAFAELGAPSDPWRPLLKASGWLVAALALIGLVFTARRRRDAGTVVIAALAAALWISIVPALGSARYRAPIDPLLVLFAAAALTRPTSIAANSTHSATTGSV